VTGLGGTKNLNLPMMTVLRRFSIVMTMVAEYYLLRVRFTAGTGAHAPAPTCCVRSPTPPDGAVTAAGVAVSVAMMVLGALLAASDDLAFDLVGYVYIFWNDFFTAANGVVVKQKLEAKKLGTYGCVHTHRDTQARADGRVWACRCGC
jgi:hypothetical protein